MRPRAQTDPSCERGQALLLVTFSLAVLFGILGFVVDLGWAYYRQQAAQTAADAAALSAVSAAYSSAGSSFTCGSSGVICQGATACPSTVPSPTVNNIQTGCAYASSNGFTVTTGGSQSVTMAADITSPPPTVSGVQVSYWVTARVSESIPQLFSAVLKNSTLNASARATAGVVSIVSNTCLYVMDPTAPNAFSASNGATVTMDCGIYVNSNNAQAASAVGGAQVTASAVNIVGGYSVNNGGKISPTPTTSVAATTDPFASVPYPSYSGCDHTNYHPGWGHWTLNPGVYCGGIIIDNGATATFNAGTYIINGGGIHFAGGTTITGSNTTFFDTGTNGTYGAVIIDNGVTATLSAPTTGSYAGLLFYQDRRITSAAVTTFAGGANMQLSGTLYFPTTSVSYSNGSNTVTYHTAIVADQISFTGAARLKLDPTGSSTGLGSAAPYLLE